MKKILATGLATAALVAVPFLTAANLPNGSLAGLIKSVGYTSVTNWKYVYFGNPMDFDPASGHYLMPYEGDSIMIQAENADAYVCDSTNFTMTVATKTTPYELSILPVKIKNGQSLVIGRNVPGLWFKTAGTIKFTAVQK